MKHDFTVSPFSLAYKINLSWINKYYFNSNVAPFFGI